MDLQLKNKTALVTGSSQGIGFAIAKKLVQEGATVVLNGLQQTEVDQAVLKLKDEIPGASVSGVAANFSDVSEITAMISKLPEIDILINNAGIYEQKEFKDITDEDWKKFFEVNVLSGVRLSRALFPKMLEKNFGRIIFISSESSANIPANMIHYGVSKTAVNAVSRGLAELTVGTGVTVNTIMPGPTATQGINNLLDKLAQDRNVTREEAEADFFKMERPSSLLQRFASIDEVANLVTYVSSPLSSATNGAALRVDGGVVKSIF